MATIKAISHRRATVEYAKINRTIAQDQLLPSVTQPFGDHLAARLREAQEKVSIWRAHTWRLGNIELINGNLAGVLGWTEERADTELAPRYDEASYVWQLQPEVRSVGAVAIFVINPAEQILALTAFSGSLSTDSFCRVLANLLNQAEQEAQVLRPTANVRWFVEPLLRRGTFQEWLRDVRRVERIRIRFHQPNPSPREILEPAIDFLNGLNGDDASLSVRSFRREGLRLDGHPLMKAALAMQDNAYGDVRAEGVTSNDEKTEYNSRHHRVRDSVENPADLTLSGVIGMLLRTLADLLDRR